MRLKPELPATGCLTLYPVWGREGPHRFLEPVGQGPGLPVRWGTGPGLRLPGQLCGGRGPWRPGGTSFLRGVAATAPCAPGGRAPSWGERGTVLALSRQTSDTHNVNSEEATRPAPRRPGRAVVGTAHRDAGAGARGAGWLEAPHGRPCHGAQAPGAFPVRAATGPSGHGSLGFWVGHEPG